MEKIDLSRFLVFILGNTKVLCLGYFACLSLNICTYTSFLYQPQLVCSILLYPPSFRAFRVFKWLATLLFPMASRPPLHRRPIHAIPSRDASRLVITRCKILPHHDLSHPTLLLALLEQQLIGFSLFGVEMTRDNR